jgi:hypothetical protein
MSPIPQMRARVMSLLRTKPDPSDRISPVYGNNNRLKSAETIAYTEAEGFMRFSERLDKRVDASSPVGKAVCVPQ